jgi:two-component system, OmpR family, phosphate regulon response regulator PhoB
MTRLVLVVEDDAPMRDLLVELLTSELAALVLAVPTGNATLRIIETLRPSVVLLNWLLPDMSGAEVCRRIKARAGLAGVPVIGMTALPPPPRR